MTSAHSSYYIVSCVFTTRYPALSAKIRQYIHERHPDIRIVRCCVPAYHLKQFEDAMPEENRDGWRELPDTGNFVPGDTVYSLCHNCSAIIEESKPSIRIRSLWELILKDEQFPYPDYGHMAMTIQDCWRANERRSEQDAVRALLRSMNIDCVELPENYEKTDFCGNSLYRPAPMRNLKLAPQRFVQGAAGKFQPHTDDEQRQIMQDYCKRFQTETMVAYCHYCVEGLTLGGVKAKHIASLLFEPDEG